MEPKILHQSSEEDQFFTPKGPSITIQNMKDLIKEDQDEWDFMNEDQESSIAH